MFSYNNFILKVSLFTVGNYHRQHTFIFPSFLLQIFHSAYEKLSQREVAHSVQKQLCRQQSLFNHRNPCSLQKLYSKSHTLLFSRVISSMWTALKFCLKVPGFFSYVCFKYRGDAPPKALKFFPVHIPPLSKSSPAHRE